MSERLKQFERVGCGAMAEVYRGALLGERGTSRQVAIKRLRPEIAQDPAAVELFVNEARIAVRLDHPNVVHALELCRDDGGYALVCEWLDCATLAELVDNGGVLGPVTVVHIGDRIGRALAYLHGLNGDDGSPLGLVHRDVTPANVFVTRSGEVKLADFGVAWCAKEGAWVEAAAGTPELAAPEQLRGEPIDGRADVYGLGATLRAIGRDLPPVLTQILDRACADDPNARYGAATELVKALAHCGVRADVAVATAELAELADVAGSRAQRCAPVQIDTAVQSILRGATGPTLLNHDAVSVGPSPRPRIPALLLFLAALALLTPLAIYFGTQSQADGTPVEAVASWSEPMPLDGGPAPEPLPLQLPVPREPQRATSRGKTTVEKTQHRAVVAEGKVSLNAIPWAHVVIDGRDVGNTPIKALSLSAGRHNVVLEHLPQKLRRELSIEVDGDCSQTFLINLRAGTVQKRRHQP